MKLASEQTFSVSYDLPFPVLLGGPLLWSGNPPFQAVFSNGIKFFSLPECPKSWLICLSPCGLIFALWFHLKNHWNLSFLYLCFICAIFALEITINI